MRKFLFILLSGVLIYVLNPFIELLVKRVFPGFAGTPYLTYSIYAISILIDALAKYLEQAKDEDVNSLPWPLVRWIAPRRYKAAILESYSKKHGFISSFNPERFLQTCCPEDFIPLQVIDPHGKNLNTISIYDAIQKYSLLMILGEIGSGKTTVLRQAVYEIAKGKHGNLSHLRKFTPVFIRLNECRPNLSEDEFIKFIADSIIQTAGSDKSDTKSELIRSYLGRFIRRGKMIFLIDGISEIADPDMKLLWYTLHPFIRKYQGNRYLFASNSMKCLEDINNGLESRKAVHVILQPLSNEDVYRFVDKFVNSIRIKKPKLKKSFKDVFPAWLKRSNIEIGQSIGYTKDIINELNRKGFIGLINKPLYLKLILANFVIAQDIYDGTSTIPELTQKVIDERDYPISDIVTRIPRTRGKLLEKLINYILKENRKYYENDSTNKNQLSIDSYQIKVLSALAYFMISDFENASVISLDQLKNILMHKLKDPIDNITINRVVDFSCTSGLIEFISSDQKAVRFKQQVIRDFFASLFIKYELGSIQNYRAITSLQYWWDTIAFFSDLSEDPEKISESILDTKQPNCGFLAILCLGDERRELPSILVQKIMQILQPLVSKLDSREIAHMFESAGQIAPSLILRIIGSRFAVQSEDGKVRIIRSLRNIRQREVIPFLIGCLLNSSDLVVQEAQKALVALQNKGLDILVNYLTKPDYLSKIKPIIKNLHIQNRNSFEWALIQQYETVRDPEIRKAIQDALISIAGNITLLWLNTKLRWFSADTDSILEATDFLFRIVFQDIQVKSSDETQVPLFDFLQEVFGNSDGKDYYLDLQSLLSLKERLRFSAPPYQRLNNLRRSPFSRILLKRIMISLMGFADGLSVIYFEMIIKARWGDLKTREHLYKAIHKDLHSSVKLIRYMGAVECASIDDPSLYRSLGVAILREKDKQLRLNMLDLLVGLNKWLAAPVLLEVYMQMLAENDQRDIAYILNISRFIKGYRVPKSITDLQQWANENELSMPSLQKAISPEFEKVFEQKLAEGLSTLEVGINSRVEKPNENMVLPEIHSTALGTMFTYKKLFEDLQKLEKAYPDNFYVLSALADISIVTTRYKNAIEPLRKIGETLDTDQRIHTWIRIYELDCFANITPSWWKPTKKISKLIGRKITQEELVFLGMQFQTEGNLLAAIQILKEACITMPSANAYSALAYALLLWGDWDKTIEVCENAVEIFPREPLLYLYQSEAELAKGDLDLSLLHLEISLKHGLDEKDYETQLEQLRQLFNHLVLEYISFNAPSLNDLLSHFNFQFSEKQLLLIARKFKEISLSNEAVLAFNLSISTKPTLDAMLELIDLLLEMNNFYDATKTQNSLLKQFPHDSQTYLYSAKINLAKGDIVATYLDILNGLNLEPESKQWDKLTNDIYQTVANKILETQTNNNIPEDVFGLFQVMHYSDIMKVLGIVTSQSSNEFVMEFLGKIQKIQESPHIIVALAKFLCTAGKQDLAQKAIEKIVLTENQDWILDYVLIALKVINPLNVLRILQSASRQNPEDRQLQSCVIDVQKQVRFFLHTEARENSALLIQHINELSEFLTTPELFGIANLFIEKDFRQEAHELLKICIRNEPKSYQYWATLGEIQLRMGHYNDALKTFDKGLIECGNYDVLLDGYKKASRVSKINRH